MSIALGAMLSSCGRTNHAEELEKQIKNMGGASAELGSVEYTISKIIAVDHDVFYKIGERKVLFSSLSTMKAGVDLEYFVPTNQLDGYKELWDSELRVDILVRKGNEFCPIELK